ncbi:hypothetical protein K7G98_16545 [Saccharothrix sp. MB29]|nr:hypothetical protein [Saccharothrix sp. MB29]
MLGVEHVGVHDNFFALGGDSILTLQLVAALARRRARVTSRDVFDRQTVADLAHAVTLAERPAVVDDPLGPVAATPIQRWFFDTFTERPDEFTMPLFVELAEGVDVGAVKEAVEAVVAHHDALRTRAVHADGWRLFVAPEETAPVFDHVDLLRCGRRGGAIARHAVTPAAGSTLPRGRWCGHSLGLSRAPGCCSPSTTWWSTACRGASCWRTSGRPAPPGLIPASGRPGAEDHAPAALGAPAHRARSRGRPGSRDRLLGGRATSPRHARPAADRGHHRGGDRAAGRRPDPGAAAGRTRCLPDPSERRAAECPGEGARGVDREPVGVGQPEGHGRSTCSTAWTPLTVGWFTSQFPVTLTLPPVDDWSAVLKSVKEQLRAVPANGIGYDALRYLSTPGSPARRLRGGARPSINVNYLGRFAAPDPAGGFYSGREFPVADAIHDAEERPFELEVTGEVTSDELVLTWNYSHEQHDEDEIRGSPRPC